MKNLRLSKSIIGEREVESVARLMLEDGYLGMGAEVKLFELEIAEFLGVDTSNVICVNTGTSALHLALQSILDYNDEVLVPSLTYLASYQAISAANGIPISCDVYEDSLTINLDDAEKKLTKKTKAIMPVHYAGNPWKLESVYKFAQKHNLRVVEDAAHAFGCKYRGKKIGSFGDIICFSFDGIKNITSGEGGAIVTFDESIIDRLKDGRLLSVERDSENRYLGRRSWDFDVKRQGYRYHMSNIFAAIGRVQLSRLESEFAPKRRTIYDEYCQQLGEIPEIIIPVQDNYSYVIPHIFPVRILNGKRDEVRNQLESLNIPTGIHYKPNHHLSFFKDERLKLETTDRIYLEMITLPMHPEITIQDVRNISLKIKNALK